MLCLLTFPIVVVLVGTASSSGQKLPFSKMLSMFLLCYVIYQKQDVS